MKRYAVQHPITALCMVAIGLTVLVDGTVDDPPSVSHDQRSLARGTRS